MIDGSPAGVVAARPNLFTPEVVEAYGSDFTLRRGEGVVVETDPYGLSDLQPNTPFRPPTW